MKLYKRLLFLILFFYLTFPFTFESIYKVQRILIYLLPTIYILCNFKILKSFFLLEIKYVKLVIFCYINILLVSVMIPILYKTYDFSYFNYTLIFAKTGIRNMMLLIIFLKIYKETASLYKYAKYYIMVCCMYVATTIVMIVVPSFTRYWMSIIRIDDLTRLAMTNLESISRVGIDGFGGFRQTFLCSIGIIFAVYMIISNNSKFKKNHATLYLSLLVLITGTFLYGRIGSIIAFVAVGILFIYFLLQRRNVKRAIAMIVISVCFLLVLNYGSQVNVKVYIWKSWAFDYIENFINGGTLTNASTETLYKMYFIPKTKTIILGDGKYTDQLSGGYYKGTDAGIMRNVLFCGVFFSIMAYLTLLFVLVGIMNCFYHNKDKPGIMLSILLSFQIVLFEMKGGIHFLMCGVLLPFYLLQLYENRDNQKEIDEKQI